MTTEVVTQGVRKARKRHTCDHCRLQIPAGSRYLYQFCKDAGETWSFRCHEDCHALAVADIEVSGCFGDEGIWPLTEHDERELLCGAWRGRFPHAVTRLELVEQLREIRRSKRQATSP